MILTGTLLYQNEEIFAQKYDMTHLLDIDDKEDRYRAYLKHLSEWIVEDIEEMEQLGIIECDDEDFALCSFACPSKIDVGGTIRQGLDLMEKES